MSKTEFLGMNIKELEEFMAANGEAPYRARQIYRWVFRKHTSSFYEMSDIPKELKEKLDEIAVISIPRVIRSRISKDGTRKFLFELIDRKRVETVAIPQAWNRAKKYTLCLSTQVGCPLGCAFCATGQAGFERNLTGGEILGQLLSAEREVRNRERLHQEERVITNLVFMGMGEPLLNLDEVLLAIRLINDEKGINIGQRHITISTAGVVPGIERLAEEKLQCTLAISLHATTDEIRSQLVPLNRRYPIGEVLKAAGDYADKTGRRITIEYVLLDGINCSPEDARRLAALVKPMLANVNLIPFNQVAGSAYSRPHEYVAQQFLSVLENDGVNVTLREEMGSDIEAACGQLKNRRGNK